MIKTRFAQFALLAGLAVVSATAAHASVSTSYTVSKTILNQPVSYTTPVTLAQFNPTLGTLQSVVLSITGTESAVVTVQNSNLTAQAFTNATAAVPVSITGPSGLVASSIVTAGPFSGTVPAAVVYSLPAPFPPTVTVNGTISSAPLTGTSPTGMANVAPADFHFYVGTGLSTISLSFTALQASFGGSANPGVYFGGNASAGALVSITYTYLPSMTVVPEPATFVALASGLVCLGLVRLRRKAA